MAKSKDGTVTLTSEEHAALLARLERLEHQQRIGTVAREGGSQVKTVVDDEYERWKADVARPAAVRSQEVADRRYGTDLPRWRVRIVSSGEDSPSGKPPDLSFHPILDISAPYPEQAQNRYMELCGIRNLGFHKLEAVPADDAAVPTAPIAASPPA